MTISGSGIQIDKGGFVRIHHDILNLLATAPLRGQQFRCLMFLLRMTYGYNRKEAKISLSEWAKGTGMRRQNVWRELKILINCNVIRAESEGKKRVMTWSFNKYHEEWRLDSVITDDDKSVITDDDSFGQSVITNDYKPEKSVINVDDKSVITRPHTRDLKDNKDNTTTTTTEGGGGSFSDSEISILKCWRDNMETADAPLTPIIVDDLKKCIATFGPREVLDAIAIAVEAENRTMRYVKGVLNRRRTPVNGANGIYTNMVLERIEDNNE